MDEMLGDAEISTLKDVLQGTEYQEALDRRAKTILGYYEDGLKSKGLTAITTVTRAGHPADEILRTAKEEEAEMIIIGSRGKRVSHVFMGSVSAEVANRSDIPVLLVK